MLKFDLAEFTPFLPAVSLVEQKSSDRRWSLRLVVIHAVKPQMDMIDGPDLLLVTVKRTNDFE